MRLRSLFTALVFLIVANIPCFGGAAAIPRVDAQHDDCDSGANHHQVVEVKAEMDHPPGMHGAMASHHESEAPSQGEVSVKARCDCGCSDTPPAAGSWARLGAALIRPSLESVGVEPAGLGEVEVAHAAREIFHSIYHVPILS